MSQAANLRSTGSVSSVEPMHKRENAPVQPDEGQKTLTGEEPTHRLNRRNMTTYASINKTCIYLNKVYQISLELGKFQFRRNKSITLDLALASRE